MRRPILCALALWLLFTEGFASGGSITGRVTARDSGEPLVGVAVALKGTVRGTTTGLNGEYRLTDLPAGKHTLIFSMVGHRRETLPDVLVQDGKETTLNVILISTPIQTEQIIVTASKRAQSLEEAPVSVSVLDAAAISDRNSLTIDEALRYVPGVNMTGSQVNIRGSSGYSRGAGSRVLMLLDGVPFLAGDSGELNFESIPAGQVDRIEVVKGASSALYGSNALGGVINIITKPIPDVSETIFRTYVGLYNRPSFSQWKWSDRARFTHGMSLTHARSLGQGGVSLFVSRQRDEGYRQNDARTRYNVYFKLDEDLSPLRSLTLTYGLLYQYGGQFLYWRNIDSALIPPLLQQNDNIKSIRYFVSGVYNDVLSDKTLFTAKAIWYHNEWGYETIHQIGRNESLSDALDGEAYASILLGSAHTLTFGLSGRADIVNADLFGRHVGYGAALYGQDEWKLSENLIATLGARYDYQALGLSQPSGQFNPKAAVSYVPTAGTTLHASAGRGFRMPSVAEMFLTGEVSTLVAVPNTGLNPERSYSYEAGISQLLGDWGKVEGAVFRSDFADLIEAGLVVSSGDLPYIQWRNVTKARVQGFETGFGLGLFRGDLKWNAGYTYVYPEDLTKNDLLKYRPRHILYSNIQARVGPISGGADFRYISRVERIDDELIDLGIVPDGDERVPICVIDVRIGGTVNLAAMRLAATVNVNNVFQRNYVELIGNLMPPRTYVLTLEAQF